LAPLRLSGHKLCDWQPSEECIVSLETVVVPGLVLSLRVENADLIQEAFKFTRPGPVLLVVTRPLYNVHGVIHLPLLVMTLGVVVLIRGTQALILLLLSGVEGRYLG
jgi:hypothetical protein